MGQGTAIVTGGGKRVGRVIVDALLADGWTVVAHVRSDDDEVPSGAIKAVADLSDARSAGTVLAASSGAPRLLVNNAARFVHDSLSAFSTEEFDAHMAINVRAPALLTAAFAEAAAKDGPADRLVVNILDAKLAAPNPDFLSYTLSKAALASLTELSARALARQGIRVNAIAPALMLQSAGQSKDNFAVTHAHNPLDREITPRDVVAAIRFLLDSPAMTGEVLTLDGGQRFLALPRDVQFLDLS